MEMATNTVENVSSQSAATQLCVVCSKPADRACPCMRRCFCSRDCQNYDWNDGGHHAHCGHNYTAPTLRPADIPSSSHDTMHNKSRGGNYMTNSSEETRSGSNVSPNSDFQPRVDQYHKSQDGWISGTTTSANTSAVTGYFNAEEPQPESYGGRVYNQTSSGYTDAQITGTSGTPYEKSETNLIYAPASTDGIQKPESNQLIIAAGGGQEGYTIDTSGFKSYAQMHQEKIAEESSADANPGSQQDNTNSNKRTLSGSSGDQRTVNKRAHQDKDTSLVGDLGVDVFVCTTTGCTKVYTSRAGLEKHLRSHDDMKPFPCKWIGCTKRFTQRGNMITHMRAHTGEKPYKCDWQDCEKSFATSSKLVVHKRAHSGEKPFACTWQACGKRFLRSGDLVYHMRTHTGERPYGCEWEGCGKRFTQGGNLITHMRSHTGERPYLCTWEGCAKRFAQSSSLEHHISTHTGEKPFLCDVEGCGKRFARSDHLANHSRSHDVVRIKPGPSVES